MTPEATTIEAALGGQPIADNNEVETVGHTSGKTNETPKHYTCCVPCLYDRENTATVAVLTTDTTFL